MADPQATTRDIATLTIGGQAYSAWEELRITRSIESLSGEFSFTLAPRQYSDQPRWPLRAGAAAEVTVGGKLVISGHLDTLTSDFDGEASRVSVTGRDRTADLVDCSAIHTPGSWANKRIDAIIAELVQPFGIALEVAGDVGAPIKKFALQQGESVFAVIDRLARFRGLIATATPAGALRLGTPASGAPVAELTQGVNIVSAAAEHDVRDRFSQIIVKGQAAGDDRNNGRAVAGVKGEARDAAVARHRPLLIIGEEQVNAADAKARAAWEASVRAGRAQRTRVTVPGWHRADGALWEPNVRLRLSAPALFITAELLLVEVALVKAGDGTTAELVLTPPDAWTPQPVPAGADVSELRQ
jgi:prophage tail gpP-like protein